MAPSEGVWRWLTLATIRSRLLVVFIITLGILLLVSSASVLVMVAAGETVRRFMGEALPQVVEASALGHLANEIALSAGILVEANSLIALSSAYNRVDELLLDLDQVATALSSTGTDPELVELQFLAQKVRSEAQLAYQLMAASRRTDMHRQQREDLSTTGLSLLKDLQQTLQQLTPAAGAYAEKILRQVDIEKRQVYAVQQRAMWSIIGISLLAAVIVIWVHWRIVARGFSQRLAIISHSLERVPTRVEQTRVPISGDDEIAGMARRLESLLDSALRIHTMATTDELTGLANRHHFYQRCELEIKRARRSGQGAVLFMMDIDFFKRVNDEFGHKGGDYALQLVANVCQQCLRSTDILARLGGEEFIVYCPDTVLTDGLSLAERVRQAIQKLPLAIAPGEPLYLTLSIGVADLQPPEMDLEGAMKRADQALYRAKDAGRNQVCA